MTAEAAAAPSASKSADWTIVLFCILGVAVCSTPVCVLSLSVFFVPLGNALGWGRGEVAAALSIWALAMTVATPFAGRLLDRVGVKPVLIVSLVSYAIVLALTPLLVSLAGIWGLYAAYTLIGIVGAGSNTVAYAHVLSGWFDKSRGLVLGFAMGGVAIGAIVAPALATWLIETYSWQTGFYGLAALPVVVGLPVAAFAIREAPTTSARAIEAGATPGLTANEAFKTRSFWTLFAVFLIVATALHGAQLHLPALMSDRGMSPQEAVSTFSLLFAVTAVMRVGAGFLFDRFFAPIIGAILFLASSVGLGMLIPEWAPMYYFIAAALVGIGTGAETDLLGYVCSRYFGMKAYGQVYGGLFAAFMIGSALGPFVFGYAFDATGGYNVALIASGIGMVLACLLLFSLPRFPQWGTKA